MINVFMFAVQVMGLFVGQFGWNIFAVSAGAPRLSIAQVAGLYILAWSAREVITPTQVPGEYALTDAVQFRAARQAVLVMAMLAIAWLGGLL